MTVTLWVTIALAALSNIILGTAFVVTNRVRMSSLKEELKEHKSDCRKDKQLMWEAIHKKADK